MGSFRVDLELENPSRSGVRRGVRSVLVDTELSWVPAEILDALGIERDTRWRFRQADGTIRLNFRVEPVSKRLVDAGPAPAAVA